MVGNEFIHYRRKQIAELRPWTPGDDMSRISVSAPDKEAGSPKAGDMIARNPKNYDDQWLVAAAYFADNFEPVAATDNMVLPHIVEYRRVGGAHWIPMAAFDVEGAAEHYAKKCGEENANHWEYRATHWVPLPTPPNGGAE